MFGEENVFQKPGERLKAKRKDEMAWQTERRHEVVDPGPRYDMERRDHAQLTTRGYENKHRSLLLLPTGLHDRSLL